MKLYTNHAQWIGLLVWSFSFFSCSQEWSAEEAMLVADPDSSVLLVQENRFTLTSYSREGGITQKGGYTYYYLTNYDLATGEKRVSIKTAEDYFEKQQLLAVIDGKAWFWSPKDDLGLHARDPKSLEVLHRESDILAKNPDWGDEFVRQAGSIDRYYTYLPEIKKLFITAASGQFYLFDDQNLLLHKQSEKPLVPSFSDQYFQIRATLKDSLRLTLEGELRKALTLNRETFSEINFLNPLFLCNLSLGSGTDALYHAQRHMIFVLSESKIGEDKEILLSGVTLSPRVENQWSIPLTSKNPREISTSNCLEVGLNGDFLILVFEKKIFCIDVARAKIHWEKVYE